MVFGLYYMVFSLYYMVFGVFYSVARGSKVMRLGVARGPTDWAGADPLPTTPARDEGEAVRFAAPSFCRVIWGFFIVRALVLVMVCTDNLRCRFCGPRSWRSPEEHAKAQLGDVPVGNDITFEVRPMGPLLHLVTSELPKIRGPNIDPE